MSLSARIPALLRTRTTQLPALARLTTIACSTQNARTPEPVSDASPDPRPHHAVVSIAGQDRTGIVNTFTNAVQHYKANIEESKMAILGGDFAMIVYVSMENPQDAGALEAMLNDKLPGFSITLRTTTAPAEEHPEQPMWTISVEAPDQPGIANAVSQALATHGGHVHEMETETNTAPFAGYALFVLNGRVSMADSELDNISEALTQVEEKFGASITLDQISRK
ncbi:Glycine cleavage system transcriptional repressor [Gracilariopsis chorda]|uniref:Glycine cleavage system transcriptional repressor n=1 Tax=Gracilariopsis chorda TaxID=448386 RepID=A0A2V3IIW6_9FLOR|nr:Glycine cleavage system transcriptional repressor [Gracilariopsis chorda]|eukprot:PXF42045.1 Glycine cleavage system transcriptional repressor [Gracilariopsis chorda]